MKKYIFLFALLTTACSTGPVVEAGSVVQIGRDWSVDYSESKGSDTAVESDTQ